MDISRINLHLADYGYSFFFSEDGTLLSEDELNSSSPIDGKTFIATLTSEEHPLCQLLLSSRRVVDILLASLNHADYPIPFFLQHADEFELVASKRQQKRVSGNVKNGLYDFIADYSDEAGVVVKRIRRKDNSVAFIIEPTPGPNHLTIDEYYVTEQATGRFIHHYAHISMIKAGARVRVYFDDQLKVVKTSAHLEEDGVKIAKLDASKLNIQAVDYGELFLILTELHQRHREKIQELDIAFTPIFMFIKDTEILANCRLKIANINRLKSPYYDLRQDFLACEPIRVSSVDTPRILLEHDESLPTDVPAATPVHALLDKVEKKQLSKKAIKQQQKLAAKGAIDPVFASIEQLLTSATQINLNVNQALEEILQLEFLMIHYSSAIEADKIEYESRIELLKLRCLDILHTAFLAGDFVLLNKSYEQGTSYIDSIIYHYLIELVEKLNQGGRTVLSSDKEKFKKLTDLLQFYYEKNELFEGFFFYLKRQLAYNPKSGSIYSFIMRMIHVLDAPTFIQFLIHKRFISASDCIGVFNFKYISLQHYMLLIAGELGSNYLNIIQYLLAENADILAITKTGIFDKLLKNPEEYRIGTYHFDRGSISRSIESAISIDSLGIVTQEIKPMTAIDYCQLNGYHLLPEPWQSVCQDFFIHHPILALNYLSILISSKSINRRVLRSTKPEIQILSSMDEMEMYTLSIALENEENKVAMSYLFYPVDGASVNIQLQILHAQHLLERIKSQPYMHEMRNDNGVMMGFMSELKKVEKADQKLNFILSAITYITMMPWCINTFKKYVYFQLNYIETLVEISQGYLIKPHIQLISEMIEAFANPALRESCHLQLLRTLEKINQTYQIEDEFMGFFR